MSDIALILGQSLPPSVTTDTASVTSRIQNIDNNLNIIDNKYNSIMLNEHSNSNAKTSVFEALKNLNKDQIQSTIVQDTIKEVIQVEKMIESEIQVLESEKESEVKSVIDNEIEKIIDTNKISEIEIMLSKEHSLTSKTDNQMEIENE